MTPDAEGENQPHKSTADALLDRAISYHQAEMLDDAKRLYQEILLLQPDHALATHHLGLIAAQQGIYQAAIKLFRKAVLLDSKQYQFHNNLGKTLRLNGETNEAINCFRKALDINPNFSDACLNLASTLQDQGSLEEAIHYYQRYLSTNPNNTIALFNLGGIYGLKGDLHAAVNTLKKGLAINPDSSEAYNNLGNFLAEQGNLDDAISAYTQAINVNPNNIDAMHNLGFALRQTGKTTEAASIYRQALSIQPDNARIYHALSSTERLTADDKDVIKMQALLKKDGIDQTDKMFLCFALGKAFENSKNYDTSFSYVLTANKIRRGQINYNIEIQKKFIDNLINTFDRTFFSARESYGTDDKMPIFIVGMPRSGTTLVEQILASHPQIHGAGEISDIKNILLKENTKMSGGHFPAMVPALEQHEIKQLAESYLLKIRSLAGNKIRVTNKMPSNFLFIGMIRLMFPRAKIIHCKRNPADTCLSCFKNYFPNSQEFSYDLSELGKYYVLYQKLMAHWHATLPDYIYDINYEDLISDQENQTRRLLDFCELPWHDACLSFHKSKRAIRTVSVEQARKPIYNSSIQGWRHYEKQLEPLLKELNQIK